MKKIYIVGDIIYDEFVYGSVNRISPEAPIPIVLFERKECYLGGCGNVAANIKNLGCDVHLISTVGHDDAGTQLLTMLNERGITSNLLKWEYPTIQKTRVVSSTNQQMLRVDIEYHEDTSVYSKQITDIIKSNVTDIEMLVISDYNKGTLTQKTIQDIIHICDEANIKVFVDSKKSECELFCNSFLVKPNMNEFSRIIGRKLNKKSPTLLQDIFTEAKAKLLEYNINNMLVTLGDLGMILISKDSNSPIYVPQSNVHQVCDVSGAGDTALATIVVSLHRGYSMEQALKYANKACAAVVQKIGTSIISSDEVFENMTQSSKVLELDGLVDVLTTLRKKNPNVTIGFTNGCFDCCHYGHLSSLKQAKQNCDILVVAINSDDWIRNHKGMFRPVQDELTRVSLISSLEFVDYCIIFSTETPEHIIRAVKPDIIMKQGYTLDKWPEANIVTEWGGKSLVLDTVDGYSTTNIIRKFKNGI